METRGSHIIFAVARFVVIGVVVCLVALGVSLRPSAARVQSPGWFRDGTVSAGLPTERFRTFGAVWADYNDDGTPDMFINRHWNNPLLYKNVGGHYARTTQNFNGALQGYVSDDARMDRHHCAWGEANGDGRPDLYCSQGADVGQGSGPNQLIVRPRRRFVDVAQRFGVDDPYGRGRTVNWLDYDLDGDLDLYVTNAGRAGSPSGMFENRRGYFERVQVGLSLEGLGEWPSTSWADWDVDGDPDVLVSPTGKQTIAFENVNGDFVSAELPGLSGRFLRAAAWGDLDGDGRPDVAVTSKTSVRVLRNDGAGFSEVTSTPLVAGRTAIWLDIENDGDLDLFVVQGARGFPRDGNPNEADFLMLNEPSGFVTVADPWIAGPTTGNGDSPTVADSNGDGRMDVFVPNGHNPSGWKGSVRLLINTTKGFGSVVVHLNGDPWNPWAYGANVSVTAGTIAYERQVTDGVVDRSQVDAGTLILGIGDAPEARIRVTWPLGGSDCYTVPTGSTVDAMRGSAPC